MLKACQRIDFTCDLFSDGNEHEIPNTSLLLSSDSFLSVLFELTLIRGAECSPASCRIPCHNCQCWHHKMPLTLVSREQLFHYLFGFSLK